MDAGGRRAKELSVGPTTAAPELTLGILASAELIELYFETEQPAERDAVLSQLAARREPEVDAFLVALLAHDDDIFLRLAAAAELGARGYRQARDVLTATLREAGDDEVLEEAIDAWVRVAGPDAYQELAELFSDPERDVGERLLALSGMERADGARAAHDFVAELGRVPTERTLDVAALEAMLGCFVRENHAPARQALQSLWERLDATQDFELRREVAAAVAVFDDAEAEAALAAASTFGPP